MKSPYCEQMLQSISEKTPHIDECLQHFIFLKDCITSDTAVFAVMKKTKRKIIHRYASSTEDLKKILFGVNEDFDSLSDLYISPNSFFIPWRRCKSLHKLGFLYVDIDNHSSNVNSHDVESLMFHLEQEYFGTKVPVPSLAVFSGRGVQLYWKLMPLSYNNKFYEFWKKIEKGLIKNMSDLDYNGFRVDTQVCDGARVLRLAGTYNVSANTHSKIILKNDNKYTLTEISQGYIFGGISSGKKYVKRRKKSPNPSEKPKANFSDESLLLQLRLEDFYKLINLRGGNLEGHRQFIIWMIANILKQLGVAEEELRDKLEEINNSFSSPLPQSEIDNEFRNKPIYKFKNDTLIAKLEITEKEQQQLTIIRSGNSKQLAKKQLTKQKRELMLETIQLLYNAGKTQKEIAAHEYVNRSERAVRNYLHELGLVKSAEATYSQVQKLKNDGFSKSEVALELGKSLNTVRKYWDEFPKNNIN